MHRYLRLPLVVQFFAAEDRIHALRNETLQNIFSAVLFEPGCRLPPRLDLIEATPKEVPATNRALLGTVYGLLLNELQRSPAGFLESCISLLKLALDLDTGTVFTSSRLLLL